MRFKIDENLPIDLADLLVQAGHEATTVLGQNLGGAQDATIASVCQQEDRVLVTLDVDFADIRTYPPEQFPGLIVLRLRQQDKPYVLSVFRRLLPLFEREPLTRHLWIVEDQRIRMR